MLDFCQQELSDKVVPYRANEEKFVSLLKNLLNVAVEEGGGL